MIDHEDFATALIFKHKFIFDAQIYFALMIKDEGSAGIMLNF